MRPRKTVWPLIVTHAAALALLAGLAWLFWRGGLGPDPIGQVVRRTGRWALVFLLLSLLPTVVRRITGWAGVMRLRRPLGLYAFLYAALHFLAFVGLDYGLDLGLVMEAIAQGRREGIGLVALIVLLLLALTSTSGWVRRLGRWWKRLHRLAYFAAGLAVLHYVLTFKELRGGPVAAGIVLLLLLGARLPPVTGLLERWRLRREGAR